jgi:hypothetical protein
MYEWIKALHIVSVIAIIYMKPSAAPQWWLPLKEANLPAGLYRQV